MKNATTLVMIALALLSLLGGDMVAATVTSSQSGNWNSTSTWGGNPAPVAGDVVIINGNFTVTVDVPNAACLSIQLGATTAGAGAGTLSFSSGSQVTVSGAVTVGVSNNKGSINMAGGGTLICQGFINNGVGTWTPGTGTVELTTSNTLPNNGITSFNNLTVSGGTTSLNANLDVTGNLVIASGAGLASGASTLTIGGGWTNDGTFTGGTGSVIFNKNGNQSITGTGANNFNLIRVNMGTSNANTLEVLSTNFSAADPFLTLSNGTFKVSGTFPLANSFILGPAYNIQPTARLWINNPNVTVTAQAGGVSVRGVLRISAGTFNIGTSVDNNLDYVAGSSIIVEGGTMNIAGHLGRNSPASTTSYTQSGGVVTVVTQGSTDIVFAGFDLGTAGSSFTMSGGTIVISNATSNASDYVNISSSANVTGGILQIGNAGTLNAQTIRIQSSVPVGNLVLSNATTQATKPTAQLVTSSLNVAGSVTLQTGTTLNANGLNISLGGDWSNGGTFTAGPAVTFNGTGAQALTKAGGESFNGLTISKVSGTLTLNSPVTVNGTFALTQGTLAIGSTTLTLNGSVTGGGSMTSGATGTVVYNQGSAGQSVLAGLYGSLSFSDFNKTLASTGSIGIAGVLTPGAATGHTVTGSTIDFNGGSQSVPLFSYNNLSLSGTGTKTGSGVLSVPGNLTVGSGAIFSGVSTLNLNGTTHTNGGTLSASTISVGPGGTLTNNGTVTSATTLTGTGTFTQGATGVLNIGGTADITSFNVATTGNTVNYTGAGQTVRPATYHHLSLSGSGAPVLTGVNTINGNFTLSGTVNAAAAVGMNMGGNFSIGSGASFNAGSFSHSLGGNWVNSGSFTPGTSTFTLNGASPQTMGGATFNTLVVNNATGVSLLADVIVANSLSLTTGPLSIGAHTLTLNGALTAGAGSLVGGASSNIVVGGSGSALALPGITLNNLTLTRANGSTLGGDVTIDSVLTISNGALNTGVNNVILGPAGSLSEAPGHTVVGNVTTTRNVTATAGAVTFGNIGADIVLGGVAPGITTVRRTTGTASAGAGHSSIRRYFDITPANNSILGAGMVFHYDSTEVFGQNPAAFELYRSRDNGTTWNNEGGTVTTASRTISATGIMDFSRWTASDTSNRIGATAAPVALNLIPASRGAGGPAFLLTVNGSNFVNGKSTIRFNGSDRTTTYVSTTELQTTIPASDLLVLGSFPVTVFNAAGGGLSNAQNFVVNPGAAASVTVETSANGTGTVAPPESLNVGGSITVYAITRDGLHNFVANVAADAWSLQNITGGVVAGDLVPAADGKSAVFTGHAVGTATIKATSGALTTVSSGTITVRIPTGIAEGSKPLTYLLMQNFPNPFNPSTQINFDLPYAGQVSLIVYDVLGREVATLAAGFHQAGHHSVTWDASRQSSGVYFYRLVVGDAASGPDRTFVAIKRLVLMK
jgi:hypothetical protein